LDVVPTWPNNKVQQGPLSLNNMEIFQDMPARANILISAVTMTNLSSLIM